MTLKYRCQVCHGRVMDAHSRESHEAGKTHQRNAQAQVRAAVNTVFDRYSGFHYDHSQPPSETFDELCEFYDWDLNYGTKGYSKAVGLVCRTVLRHYEAWTEATDDLDVWHSLCRAVGIQEMPKSKTQCRKVLETTHVNVVDLLLAVASDEEPHVFSSSYKLRKYTRRTHKYINKYVLEPGSPLRQLLREF